MFYVKSEEALARQTETAMFDKMSEENLASYSETTNFDTSELLTSEVTKNLAMHSGTAKINQQI